TAGHAGVARAVNHRDALGSRLLVDGFNELIFGGTQLRFAGGEAGGHNRREVMVHDVLGREIHAIGRVGRRGDDEVDRGVGGDRARPLHIQIGLALVVAAGVARIGTVNDHLRQVGRIGRDEEFAEIADVIGVHVAAADYGDGFALAVNG